MTTISRYTGDLTVMSQFEPPFDDDFRPIGECSICDEPFERGYECASCHEPVCPACVCVDLRSSDRVWLCPECEGAGIYL